MWTLQRPFRSSLIVLGSILLLSSCELDEVTLAQPKDIVVVESYIMVGDGPDQATAFLHWTLGTRPVRDLLDITVTMTREDGTEAFLLVGELDECLLPGLEEVVEGVCYVTGFNAEGFFQPGTRVELEVILDDDDILNGGTMVPEDIQLIHPAVRNQCALLPGEELEFVWNRSPGVWAYAAETEIQELRGALALQGLQVETDSVALVGLAISDSDTTIVFPQEFGVFERFSLEQEVAVALQDGLPRGAEAKVVIAALDQNYVNWVRGGNFNPSGPVRVSSLRGSGVGVFGSVVRRSIDVKGGDPSYLPGFLLPDCNQGP